MTETLGQRIYALRTAKNLSQGDVADALDVSRQSVSKWETDGAVPELDKLVKLCGLFEVSLDTLVRGEEIPAPPEAQPAAEIRYVEVRHRPAFFVGIVLLALGVLAFLLLSLLSGYPLEAAVLCLPFWVCGAICLTVKKRTALWCLWALWIMAYAYLRWATGIRMEHVFVSWMYSPEMGMHAIFAWAELIPLLALIAATAVSFLRKKK